MHMVQSPRDVRQLEGVTGTVVDNQLFQELGRKTHEFESVCILMYRHKLLDVTV